MLFLLLLHSSVGQQDQQTADRGTAFFFSPSSFFFLFSFRMVKLPWRPSPECLPRRAIVDHCSSEWSPVALSRDFNFGGGPECTDSVYRGNAKIRGRKIKFRRLCMYIIRKTWASIYTIWPRFVRGKLSLFRDNLHVQHIRCTFSPGKKGTLVQN